MRKQILLFIFCVLVIVLAYSNTFNSGLHYDDSVNIIRNSHIHIEKLDWQSIKGTWFSGGSRGDIYHPILYRPVAQFSFALNYYFHGLNVLGYHIVNILIHLITAMFLFLFIREVLTLPKLRERYGDYAWQIAGIATLLWAINPVQLTNVTYIVQRQNSLCGLFYALGFYFYIRARKSKSGHLYVFSGLAIVMAMASKENAILALPAIALFEVMFFGITRKKLIVFAGFVVAGILLTLAVQGPETFGTESLMKGYAKRDFTLGQRLLTEPRVVVFYIMLLLFPYHGLLSLTHVVPLSYGLIDPPETIVGLAIIALILALAALKIRKHPLICFCVFFFFLNHLVESTVIPLELVYEHRNYIPSFLFFLPVAILIVHAYRHWLKSVAIVGTALIVLFMGYNTYTQNKVWKTDLSLWADVCKKSPDPRSVFNYAGALYTLGDKDNAMRYWMVAMRFNDYYGTEYKESDKIIPYGRVMAMAAHNAFMLQQIKDGKFRKAWTLKATPPGHITEDTNG